jgi:hypothetical protein
VATVVIVGLPQIRRLTAIVATAAIVTVAAASGAYALATASTTYSGSIPISGPAEYSTGGFGGMRGGEASSSELTTLLSETTTEWAAATTGATSAANLQLASGKAVIAIGGWNGSDPAPTLAQFQQWVSEGRISYYVSGGGMGGGPGRGNSEIAQWVAANYTASTVGGATVYDLRG